MLAKAVFHTETISVTTEGGGQMGQLPPTAARPDPDIRADLTRNVFRKNGGWRSGANAAVEVSSPTQRPGRCILNTKSSVLLTYC